jgi:hypothetical protein
LTSPGLLYFPDDAPPPPPPPPPPPVFGAPPPAFLADFFPAYVTTRRVVVAVLTDGATPFCFLLLLFILDTKRASRARIPPTHIIDVANMLALVDDR